MELPKASAEQQNVIQQLSDKNVVVDSVAGSGKTTTILHVAKEYKTDNILLLTYNKRLKMETRTKVSLLEYNNIEVHSYHSFCVKYYDNKCFTDYEIIKIIDRDNERKKKFRYDIIILDEAQDMSPLYYELVCKIIRDSSDSSMITTDSNMTKVAKLCILGDRYQSIFEFNKADDRFITYADKLFNFGTENNWATVSLSTSFRITHEIARFINRCLLDGSPLANNEKDRIKAAKSGIKPRYRICDCFKDSTKKGNRNVLNDYIPYREVKSYLQKYGHDDIFILAPSVRSERSPVRLLANKLTKEGIPIYVPNTDDERLDEDILKGKIAFSTFHQVKGLERKVVIVFNFDDSYFKYYKKGKSPYVCPNELYVATTRAKECLTVLHHYSNDFLPFLKKSKLKKYTDFYNDHRFQKAAPTTADSMVQEVPVTELTRYVPSSVLANACTYLEVITVEKKGDKIKIPVTTKQGLLHENVADITGTAIPAYYEYVTQDKMTIFDKLDTVVTVPTATAAVTNDYMFVNDMEDISMEDDDTLIDNDNDDSDDKDLTKLTPEKLLRLSNEYCAHKSGYVYKLNQIKEYNWLTTKNLEMCVDRLINRVSSAGQFEVLMKLQGGKPLLNKVIVGYIDCVDNDTVWEFKCTEELGEEHVIQLAIYSTMVQLKYPDKKFKFYLYNILTSECKQVLITKENGIKMLELLVHTKYNKSDKDTDAVFLSNMNSIREFYFDNSVE